MTSDPASATGADPSSASFFEARYQAQPDPWAFESDEYEKSRYEEVLSHVGVGDYALAFEPGCSIGVLTEHLAQRCATVVATDLSPTAVAAARRRCERFGPRVRIDVGGLLPDRREPFDLVVISEVGYYLDEAELVDATADLAALVDLRGRLVASHWLGHSPDHRLHADVVHTTIGRHVADWRHRIQRRILHPSRGGFVIDVWDRP